MLNHVIAGQGDDRRNVICDGVAFTRYGHDSPGHSNDGNGDRLCGVEVDAVAARQA